MLPDPQRRQFRPLLLLSGSGILGMLTLAALAAAFVALGADKVRQGAAPGVADDLVLTLILGIGASLAAAVGFVIAGLSAVGAAVLAWLGIRAARDSARS